MTAAETLLAEAVAAVNAGDYKTAANRFERAGELLSAKGGKKLGKGRARDAAAAYESAARCYLMLNDHDHAIAAVELARRLQPASPRVARVHAEVADRVGYAPTRRQAWQDVLAAGRPSDRMFAQLQLASISRELGEHGLAAKHFAEALDALEPTDEPTLRPELHLEIAMSRTASGEYALADTALAEAEKHAGGDAAMRSRIVGQRGSLALARGDDQTALKLGEAARAQAVANRDVLTYLGAAQLIASVHERANRLIDAYDTYIRTRESLADLLGDPGRELVKPAIELFEERLGPERFREVWNEWVARRKAAAPTRQ